MADFGALDAILLVHALLYAGRCEHQRDEGFFIGILRRALAYDPFKFYPFYQIHGAKMWIINFYLRVKVR